MALRNLIDEHKSQAAGRRAEQAKLLRRLLLREDPHADRQVRACLAGLGLTVGDLPDVAALVRDLSDAETILTDTLRRQADHESVTAELAALDADHQAALDTLRNARTARLVQITPRPRSGADKAFRELLDWHAAERNRIDAEHQARRQPVLERHQATTARLAELNEARAAVHVLRARWDAIVAGRPVVNEQQHTEVSPAAGGKE